MDGADEGDAGESEEEGEPQGATALGGVEVELVGMEGVDETHDA